MVSSVAFSISILVYYLHPSGALNKHSIGRQQVGRSSCLGGPLAANFLPIHGKKLAISIWLRIDVRWASPSTYTPIECKWIDCPISCPLANDKSLLTHNNSFGIQ